FFMCLELGISLVKFLFPVALCKTMHAYHQGSNGNEIMQTISRHAAFCLFCSLHGNDKMIMSRCSGVKFAQRFLVGLPHDFLFTLALRRRSDSVNLLSLQLLEKRCGT